MVIENPYLSVVVPFFNEEENVGTLYKKLKDVLSNLNISYELIFIDDGSKDETFSLLVGIHNKDKNFRIARLTRNFGQTAALSAGFDLARGKVIIAMDGDLQHDPEDIPQFLKKIDEGYDIVSGWRKNRVDSFFTRRLPSLIANKLISLISGVKIHDFGTTFKAYRSEVIKNIELFGELHRYIPALASWSGASVVEIPIKNICRKYGKSKYGLSRTMRVILDLIILKYLINFIYSPLKIFGSFGLLIFLSGFSIDLILVILFLIGKIENIWSRGALLLLSVLLMIIGIQFITVGTTAEINTRIYHNVRQQKNYRIKELID